MILRRAFGAQPSTGPAGGSGATFDGQYVYPSPRAFGPRLRFEARDAAPVPTSYEGGSYY